MSIKCSNGENCLHGETIERDDFSLVRVPADAYSQSGNPMYHGLCLNCLDDYNRYLEDEDWRD